MGSRAQPEDLTRHTRTSHLPAVAQGERVLTARGSAQGPVTGTRRDTGSGPGAPSLREALAALLTF